VSSVPGTANAARLKSTRPREHDAKLRTTPMPANVFIVALAEPSGSVEGILALHFAELRPYFDLSIYLDAPDKVGTHRRKVRDITQRQRSLDLIRWQYKNHVVPAARQYLFPGNRYASVVVESTADLPVVEKSVYEIIVEKPALVAAQ
jgi:uridine kinase